jgi:hypothetical protein
MATSAAPSPTTTVSVSRDIAASPDTVWALIADLPRMGDWSPESTGGSWAKGATGPKLGAHFKGTNANGAKKWNTHSVVTACEPARAFAFDVSAVGFKVATWRYLIEATDSGCTVTETWTDSRGWVVKTVGTQKSGVKDRADSNRAGMEKTLENLAAAVES